MALMSTLGPSPARSRKSTVSRVAKRTTEQSPGTAAQHEEEVEGKREEREEAQPPRKSMMNFWEDEAASDHPRKAAGTRAAEGSGGSGLVPEPPCCP